MKNGENIKIDDEELDEETLEDIKHLEELDRKIDETWEKESVHLAAGNQLREAEKRMDDRKLAVDAAFDRISSPQLISGLKKAVFESGIDTKHINSRTAAKILLNTQLCSGYPSLLELANCTELRGLKMWGFDTMSQTRGRRQPAKAAKIALASHPGTASGRNASLEEALSPMFENIEFGPFVPILKSSFARWKARYDGEAKKYEESGRRNAAGRMKGMLADWHKGAKCSLALVPLTAYLPCIAHGLGWKAGYGIAETLCRCISANLVLQPSDESFTLPNGSDLPKFGEACKRFAGGPANVDGAKYWELRGREALSNLLDCYAWSLVGRKTDCGDDAKEDLGMAFSAVGVLNGLSADVPIFSMVNSNSADTRKTCIFGVYDGDSARSMLERAIDCWSSSNTRHAGKRMTLERLCREATIHMVSLSSSIPACDMKRFAMCFGKMRMW